MVIFGRREPYLLITPSTKLSDLQDFFKNHYAGFVTDGNNRWPLAVITRDDLGKRAERTI